MRLHSRWIGEDMDPILVTGGASRNPGILRILADVFQATIVPLQVSNSSALGAALRAAQAVGGTSWEELARRFSAPAHDLAVKPDPTTRAVYDEARPGARAPAERGSGTTVCKGVKETHAGFVLFSHRTHSLRRTRFRICPVLPLLRQGSHRARQAHGGSPAHGGVLLAHLCLGREGHVRRRDFPAALAGRGRRARGRQAAGRGGLRFLLAPGRALLLFPRSRRLARGPQPGRDQQVARRDGRCSGRPHAAHRREAAVGHRQSVLAPALHGGRCHQP
jgi:hypothetical protein